MKIKSIFMFLLDIASFFCSFLLYRFFYGVMTFPTFAQNMIVFLAIYSVLLVVFGSYRSPIKIMNLVDTLRVGLAITLSYIIIGVLNNFIGNSLSLKEVAGSYLLNILFCAATRFILRGAQYYLDSKNHNTNDLTKKAVVIGAGSAGRFLANNYNYHGGGNRKVVAFIDKDKSLCHKYICGVKVEGDLDAIPNAIAKYKANDIIISIPNVSSSEIMEVLKECQQTGCAVYRFGDIRDISTEELGTNSVQKIKVEDLLGRNPITLNVEKINEHLKDKVVLVTGGAGSIGSEICRQVIMRGCKKVIIFDRAESELFDISNELNQKFPGRDICICTGSIRDVSRVNQVLKMHRPSVVYHAAAYKHVPMSEANMSETALNNVFGTFNVARLCMENNVKSFILISTDKAVNPTSFMGATKNIAESIIRYFNTFGKTRYSAVRFGNVLESRGSVVPTFRRQISMGGPVTVTHRDIERFFMTIPEAVQLVLQAGASAKGDEIYVLDMGESIKIYDLASMMIQIAGFVPNKDIMIEVVGLRTGEKLYEEIHTDNENVTKTENERIYVLKEEYFDTKTFIELLNRLEIVANQRKEEAILPIIQQLVPSYTCDRVHIKTA